MENSYSRLNRSAVHLGYKAEEGEFPFSSYGDNSFNYKLQAENEYMTERIKSCERGLTGLYQLLVVKDEPKPPSHHYRSASQSGSSSNPCYSPIPQSNSRRESGNIKKSMDESTNRLVTFPELREAINIIISDRNKFHDSLEDQRQIAEAAKRERVIAIDEKDHLLRESHELKVALDKMSTSMKENNSEHRKLTNQIRDMERDMTTLRRSNEEAIRMRSIALEERAKVIEEFSQMQEVLTALRNERAGLMEETIQMQSSLAKVNVEKRKLLQEMDWLSKRCSGYEAFARTLKEQNEALNGTVYNKLTFRLARATPGQPWGFSIEGVHGSEFCKDEPTIVVSAVATKTPADGILLFGDRMLSMDGTDFTNITKRQSAEAIRSCDKLLVNVEVARVTAHVKPSPKEVKIPGKKVFGFSYETRLFISQVQPLSPAADLVAPGDEITQVLGKPASNMKLSIFKQLLKNCKDGVSMVIQPPQGSGTSKLSNKLPKSTTDPIARFSGNGQRSSNEFAAPYPAPGTPGSTVSESSAGYYSLTHSMPSITANPPGTDHRSGQTGLEPVLPDLRTQSQLTTYREEDELCEGKKTETNQFHTASASGRHRPTNVYAPRRNTTNIPTLIPVSGTRSNHAGFRSRTTSQTSFGGGHATSPRTTLTPHTPVSDISSFPRFTYKDPSLSHDLNAPHVPSYSRKQVISMSADQLDMEPHPSPPPALPSRTCTKVSRTVSHNPAHGSHMIRSSLTDVSHGGHMTRRSSHDMPHDISHDGYLIPVRSKSSQQTHRPISMSLGSMQTHV